MAALHTNSPPADGPVAGRSWLPMAPLNLRVNPFGEWAREDRIAMAQLDAAPWLGALQHERHALQFVGACGRGKSTHLLALARLLAFAPHGIPSHYCYLPPRGPCPPFPAAGILLIDEAQRLPWLRRRRLLRQGRPLVLGTHRDGRGPLQRAGYTVETVDLDQLKPPEQLAAILNRRIEHARLGDGPLPSITPAEAARLQIWFGSNIRAAEHYLYHQFQIRAGASGGKL